MRSHGTRPRLRPERCLGKKWQSHIEFKSMLINPAYTFADNRHGQHCVPIPIPHSCPCVWGQRKGEVCNLGARRFPSRLRAMLRKSLHSAVPPSHCWRNTSHCTLITEYLNTYTRVHGRSSLTQPQIKIHTHRPSSNSAAWCLEKFSFNWIHVQTHHEPCVLVEYPCARHPALYCSLWVTLW